MPLWTSPRFLGTNPNCSPPPSGISSTPTLATVSINNQPTPVLFIGGNNPFSDPSYPTVVAPIFYALDAATGQVRWQTVLSQPNLQLTPSTYIWDSPAVYQGSVYIGVAEALGCPEPQGTFYRLNASTGAIEHTLPIVPDGCVGGGVWGSPTIDTQTNTVYIVTGDPDSGAQPQGCTQTPDPTNCTGVANNYSESVLALNATDLAVQSCWTVPSSQQITDGDFGSTPTLFQENLEINGQVQATDMVGGANKNGWYYAFNRDQALSVGPVWEYPIAEQTSQGGPLTGQGSISPSAWDQSLNPNNDGVQGTLYLGGGSPVGSGSQNPCTTDTNAAGSLQAFDLNAPISTISPPVIPTPMGWVCFDNSGNPKGQGDGPVVGPVMAIAGTAGQTPTHEAVVGEGSWFVVLATDSLTPTASYNEDPNGINGKFDGGLTVAYDTLYLGDAIPQPSGGYVGYFYIYQ
jgi:hypothetical protein